MACHLTVFLSLRHRSDFQYKLVRGFVESGPDNFTRRGHLSTASSRRRSKTGGHLRGLLTQEQHGIHQEQRGGILDPRKPGRRRQ